MKLHHTQMHKIKSAVACRLIQHKTFEIAGSKVKCYIDGDLLPTDRPKGCM